MLFEPLEAVTYQLVHALPAGLVSVAVIEGKSLLRCVAANPLADIDLIINNLDVASRETSWKSRKTATAVSGKNQSSAPE